MKTFRNGQITMLVLTSCCELIGMVSIPFFRLPPAVTMLLAAKDFVLFLRNFDHLANLPTSGYDGNEYDGGLRNPIPTSTTFAVPHIIQKQNDK